MEIDEKKYAGVIMWTEIDSSSNNKRRRRVQVIKETPYTNPDQALFDVANAYVVVLGEHPNAVLKIRPYRN